MWPWEHLAVGYLCLSVCLRLGWNRPPKDVEAVVLAVATQLPDLVDKPLSWGLGVFPNGYAVGHSALVCLPLGAALLVWSARTGWATVAVALVVGHWTHLAGDVLSPLRALHAPAPGRVLWPLVVGEGYGADIGLRRVLVYLARFPAEVASLDPSSPAMLYLLLPLPAVLLWVADGTPGVGLAVRTIRRVGPRREPGE